MTKNYLRALTLGGQPRLYQGSGPLAIIHLENRLYIFLALVLYPSIYWGSQVLKHMKVHLPPPTQTLEKVSKQHQNIVNFDKVRKKCQSSFVKLLIEVSLHIFITKQSPFKVLKKPLPVL